MNAADIKVGTVASETMDYLLDLLVKNQRYNDPNLCASELYEMMAGNPLLFRHLLKEAVESGQLVTGMPAERVIAMIDSVSDQDFRNTAYVFAKRPHKETDDKKVTRWANSAVEKGNRILETKAVDVLDTHIIKLGVMGSEITAAAVANPQASGFAQFVANLVTDPAPTLGALKATVFSAFPLSSECKFMLYDNLMSSTALSTELLSMMAAFKDTLVDFGQVAFDHASSVLSITTPYLVPGLSFALLAAQVRRGTLFLNSQIDHFKSQARAGLINESDVAAMVNSRMLFYYREQMVRAAKITLAYAAATVVTGALLGNPLSMASVALIMWRPLAEIVRNYAKALLLTEVGNILKRYKESPEPIRDKLKWVSKELMTAVASRTKVIDADSPVNQVHKMVFGEQDEKYAPEKGTPERALWDERAEDRRTMAKLLTDRNELEYDLIHASKKQRPVLEGRLAAVDRAIDTISRRISQTQEKILLSASGIQRPPTVEEIQAIRRAKKAGLQEPAEPAYNGPALAF